MNIEQKRRRLLPFPWSPFVNLLLVAALPATGIAIAIILPLVGWLRDAAQ